MAEPSRSLSPSTRTHCNVHSFDQPVTYGRFLSFCTPRLGSDAGDVDVGIFTPHHHSCGAGAKRIPRHGSTPCLPSAPVLPGPHTPWTLCRVASALRARPVQKTSRAAVYLTERVSPARTGEAGMGGAPVSPEASVWRARPIIPNGRTDSVVATWTDPSPYTAHCENR